MVSKGMITVVDKLLRDITGLDAPFGGKLIVFGGDFPDVDRASGGLLGADLVLEGGGWRIQRIYTSESWNPNLTAPLDQPQLEVAEGDYLVGVNGTPLTANDDPYRQAAAITIRIRLLSLLGSFHFDQGGRGSGGRRGWNQ